nr:unnamed protein product [Spirometra erinaceieuropaei]
MHYRKQHVKGTQTSSQLAKPEKNVSSELVYCLFVNSQRQIITDLREWGTQSATTFMRHPPTDAPYTKLKTELLRLISVSGRQRYHAQVKEEALGDRKPSGLLRRMRSLVENMAIDDTFFKDMFLERLPTSVQIILASGSDDLDISKLAEMADHMVEAERLSSPTTEQRWRWTAAW